MYRKPLEEDEQREDIQISYPRQRHRRTITGNASLQQSYHSSPAGQQTRKVVPDRHPMGDYHLDEHPEIPRVARASRLKAQNEKEDRQERAEVLKRAPLRTLPFARRSRRQFSLKDHLQSLSHNRRVLIIGTLAIMMLILAPIMFAARADTRPLRAHTTAPTPVKSTPVSINQASANPHEIVIIPPDTDHPPPPMFAQSAYLLDADTGVTLYAYNPFKHIPPMSTTKLMTAVIALEIGNPVQKITITDAIQNDLNQLSPDSSLFGVKMGETYTLSDLLYGLLLMSGNDAAVVIADGLSGNIQNFVAKMNQKALQLGMYDTHYMNPHGLLNADHYSSAHDLAVIGRYSMNIPLIHKITGTEVYTLPPGNHPNRILLNGNQFLWWYPGVDGGKPGWDAATNFVQVISCTRNHHHLIGVVMHSKNYWTDMRDLLNWGFNDFTWISPHDVDLQHPIIYDSDSNYFASDKKENTVPTADNGRYYIYTGFSISGSIMAYFDQGGGLKKFGYPISLPSVSSTQVIGQRFEHATIQCSLETKQCTTST